MEKKEFSEIRHHLGKTQLQMAQLVGVSLKAIQSFEQGWRNIPVHTERQVLFLLASKKSPPQKESPAGRYESVLRRRDIIVLLGSFKLAIFAGLSMGQSAKERR